MSEGAGVKMGESTMGTQLRWGVLGCGVIANQMASALAEEGRTLAGVANRSHDKAVAFAAR